MVLLIGNIAACSPEKETEPTVQKNKEPVIRESNINRENEREKERQNEDDIPTLTLVQKDFVPSNPDDMAYVEKINTALLENGIKAKLELVELPRGGYSEKLNLMLQGGHVPDMIWFRDGMDEHYMEEGLLVDLTEYINDSDVFNQAMEPYHKARITSYPYLLNIRYNTPKIALVRQDWLDALGLKSPETVDDYYRVLKAFADSDFDDNGEKDTYGITATGGTERLDAIFNGAFGMPTTWIQGDDGQYIYHKVSQNEKEKLAFYRRLREEKILDPTYITTKWDTMEEKLYTGKVGMVVGSAGKVVDIYSSKLQHAGADTLLIPLNPPKGHGGQGFAPVDVTKEQKGFAISTVSEHQELAFQVLEFMASDEGQYLDRLGFEGRDYEKDGHGKITRTEKGQEWYARFFDVPSWQSPVPLITDVAQASLDITARYYMEDKNFDIPSEHSAKWETMNNLYKEYAYKIIMGDYTMDKFDEFVNRWYEAGGNEITALANKILLK